MLLLLFFAVNIDGLGMIGLCKDMYKLGLLKNTFFSFQKQNIYICAQHSDCLPLDVSTKLCLA